MYWFETMFSFSRHLRQRCLRDRAWHSRKLSENNALSIFPLLAISGSEREQHLVAVDDGFSFFGRSLSCSLDPVPASQEFCMHITAIAPSLQSMRVLFHCRKVDFRHLTSVSPGGCHLELFENNAYCIASGAHRLRLREKPSISAACLERA